MWWPFGQKQAEEKEKPTMYLVLPDNPEVTIENYQALCAWFVDPVSGCEADACYEQPTSFPPDTPWIREAEFQTIRQRFAARCRQQSQ